MRKLKTTFLIFMTLVVLFGSFKTAEALDCAPQTLENAINVVDEANIVIFEGLLAEVKTIDNYKSVKIDVLESFKGNIPESIWINYKKDPIFGGYDCDVPPEKIGESYVVTTYHGDNGLYYGGNSYSANSLDDLTQEIINHYRSLDEFAGIISTESRIENLRESLEQIITTLRLVLNEIM